MFSVKALVDASQRCNDMTIREHSTLYIRIHPERYRIKNFDAPKHFNRPDLSLGLDVEEDLIIVETVISAFGNGSFPTLAEIIDYMDDNPDLAKINRHVARRWRQYRSA